MTTDKHVIGRGGPPLVLTVIPAGTQPGIDHLADYETAMGEPRAHGRARSGRVPASRRRDESPGARDDCRGGRRLPFRRRNRVGPVRRGRRARAARRLTSPDRARVLQETGLLRRYYAMRDRSDARKSLKSTVKRVLPEPYLNYRVRRHQRAVRAATGLTELSAEFVKRYGAIVRRGPLQGLRYPAHWASDADVLISKLVGAYEAELHPILFEQIAAQPTVFVDIGCAEGSYAVGLLLASPRTRTVAFDRDREARQRCAELAQANGVESRVQIKGSFTAAALDADVEQSSAFVLCDIEGAEFEVFKENLVSRLQYATLLIELHAHGADRERQIEEFAGRFAGTHAATRILPRRREPQSYPELAEFETEARHLALREFRARPDGWLLLRPLITPRPRGAAAGG
jgi:hypothetical protein